MTVVGNPLKEPVSVLFSRLNLLLGLLNMLYDRMMKVRQELEQVIENGPRTASGLFYATRLAISDITEWPSSGCMEYFPTTGTFASKGTEYLGHLDEIINRNAGWTVSQGYEAFETFLFDQAAAYLHLRPDQADSSVREKFERRGKNQGAESTRINYWNRFARYGYRGSNNGGVFKLLRSFASDIADAETKNTRQLNLRTWYGVVSEVRHAVTHSDFVVKEDRLRSWPDDNRRLMLHLFPTVHDDVVSGYRLQLGCEAAKTALTYFGEYAFVICKCLSKTEAYDLDLWGQVNGSPEKD